jgi:GAF domain-containing protein
VTRRLLSDEPPAEILTLITDLVLELSGADLAVLALPADQSGYLTIEHASGAGAELAIGLALPVQASVSSWPAASRCS